jgi:hypothetical protein
MLEVVKVKKTNNTQMQYFIRLLFYKIYYKSIDYLISIEMDILLESNKSICDLGHHLLSL